MKIKLNSISGLKVTVMGLGLHGGGLASARYFAERGAEVTVTDLRGEEILAPSLEKLKPYSVKYVLGRHELSDFEHADLVIKNPAVAHNSPFLKAAKQVETDISIFLHIFQGPVAAITGSKGKSTTAAAMHHILKTTNPRAQLGGNITVSPLDFLVEGGPPDAPVVLELSSWQLADLRGKGVLAPQVAIITNILRDHQDRYESMDHYISDKMVLFEGQEPGQKALFNYDDPVLNGLSTGVSADTVYFSKERLPQGANGGYLKGEAALRRDRSGEVSLFESTLLIGSHSRINLLAAALGCSYLGVSDSTIHDAAATFPGIEHRLEFVRTLGGVSFYNDSSATIPDATVAAALSFNKEVIIIAGGTDKELDFGILAALKGRARKVYLLDGNASQKISNALRGAGVPLAGPFPSLGELISSIMNDTRPGDIVVFSPGCTSFEMFLNEFDRGRQFKAIVERLPD